MGAVGRRYGRFWIGGAVVELPVDGRVLPPGVPLPPVDPRQVFGVGLNFAEHVGETGSLDRVPPTPVIFMKPLSSVVASGARIPLPRGVGRVDYEGELAVVVGRLMHRVSPEEAREAIRGYTLALDITARDLQKQEPQWIRAKGYPAFCPLGPYIAEIPFPEGELLVTRVNGEERQRAPLSAMIRKPWEILSFISQFAVLYPGDVVLLGTPRGVGPLQAGDRVEVEVPSIGVLMAEVVDDAGAG